MATLGLPLVHTPPDTVELNTVVVPSQRVSVPLKVPELNPELIVAVLVAVVSEHPPVPVTV